MPTRPPIPLGRLALLLALLLAAVRPAAAQDAPLDPLPLLSPGPHLATTIYGSAEMPEAGSWAEQHIAEAAAAGMSGFTFYVDWADLEPMPGTYHLSELEATLAWLSGLDLAPFVNITVVDIDNLNLPAEYLDDEGGVAEGQSFADPALVGRFLGLLDRVVPLLLEHGGFYLGLGNEVDVRYDERPEEFADYLAFVAAAVEHVHGLEPRLAAGVTVTGGAPLGQTPVFEALRAVSDVVPFNYYGLDPNTFAAEDVTAIPGILRTILDAYGDDVTMVQETNCVSAEAPGSSPALQAACLDVILTAMREAPQIRFVTVFNLLDLDEPTCDLFVELFGFNAEFFPPDVRENLRAFVCDVGLIAPDGTPKPAWDVFLEAADQTTGTSVEDPADLAVASAVAVYPHPVRAGMAAATLRFTLQAAGTADVALHDLLGREMSRRRVAVAAGVPALVALDELTPSALAPGLYLVRVQQGAQAHHRRLVVVR